jgi:hypothetical protein
MQNGRALTSLSLTWGSADLEHTETAWREKEDKLGFRAEMFGENLIRAPLFIGLLLSNRAQLSHNKDYISNLRLHLVLVGIRSRLHDEHALGKTSSGCAIARKETGELC